MAAYKYDIRAMLRKFGVVTVMDVKAYKTVLHTEDKPKTVDGEAYSKGEWDAKGTFTGEVLFELDTLKIANINQEGPTKTITGGQNADVLLKYGKTLTVEMQDALGKYDVLEHIYGVNFSGNYQIATITDGFPGELTLVGTTFVIDQPTGAKQPIKIVIPRFLGDGIFNLTQDAEGEASVFDMNGNILKFEGGVTAGEIEVSGLGKLYDKGADNEFYFLCTNEGFEEIEAKGYREAWGSTESSSTDQSTDA